MVMNKKSGYLSILTKIIDIYLIFKNCLLLCSLSPLIVCNCGIETLCIYSQNLKDYWIYLHNAIITNLSLYCCLLIEHDFIFTIIMSAFIYITTLSKKIK